MYDSTHEVPRTVKFIETEVEWWVPGAGEGVGVSVQWGRDSAGKMERAEDGWR